MSSGAPSASSPPTSAPRLADLVRSLPAHPVFVPGGPPRRPFTGDAPATWSNPAYALHHARSWDSPFVLGAMLPLKPSAHPELPATKRLLERHRSSLENLAEGGLPVVAQVWGPMTMASTRTGLQEMLGLLREGADPVSALAEGLEATLIASRIALATHPLVLWIGEPLPVLVDPLTLERSWLAPMRSLVALARSAGTEPVIHMSGAASHVLPLVERIGAAGVSITADTPLPTARELLGEQTVVFGNLDSMRLLDRDNEWLAGEARSMIAAMRGRPFVLTPGSALLDHMPVEPLAAFVDAARG